MIGRQLQSASNTLDLLVQSGDWKKDKKLEQATIRLSQVLEQVDRLPELQTAYTATVNAYSNYINHHQQPQQ